MAKQVEPGSPMDVDPETLPPHKGEKLVAVTLRGVGMTEEGTLVRKNLLNILGQTEDDYSDIELTPDQANRLQRQMAHMTNGLSSSIPVICAGPACPWKSRCYYFQIDKAPVGKQCLIELNILKQAQLDFMSEYKVSLDNRTEIGMIQELSEIEVLLHRANLNMAIDVEEATGVVNAAVGVDNAGHPIFQKQVSQNIELREKLLDRRRKLTKLMVGDRQEKYKREAALKVREDKDPSSRMAEVREKLDNLSREVGRISARNQIELGTSTVAPVESDAPLSPDDIITGKKSGD